MTDETVDFALTRALEAILFAADAPLSLTEITRHVGERGDLLRMLEESVVNLDEAVRTLVKKATRQI